MVFGWGKKKNNQSNSVDVINSGGGANGSYSRDALNSHHTPLQIYLNFYQHTILCLPNLYLCTLRLTRRNPVAPLSLKGANPLGLFHKGYCGGRGGWEARLVKSHIFHHPWNLWLFKENFGSHNLRNIAN